MKKQTQNKEKFVLAPASIPQEQFLASDSTITLYAGSAGAGKSFALIMNMVKFAAKQHSTIVCFRRTSTQIKAPGSIWSEALPIFIKMFPDCKIRTRELEIYIPNTNSVVKFSHLQHSSDVLNHLGAQYSAIFYDEVTTFPLEEFVLPLLGRMRNAKVNYSPQLFMATNPMYNHGIYHWIKDFYLDENGIPLKERSNIERYFVLQDNKPVWYDDLSVAEQIHGKGIPRSFRSIRAHVTDNIPLLKNNPDYLSNLLALPEIKRKIYLDGSWTAREEHAGYFKREWVHIAHDIPNTRNRVRAWDLAASPPSSANPNPDYTAGVLVSKTTNGSYCIEDVKRLRDRTHKVEEFIFDIAEMDGEDVTICLPLDPGASGMAYTRDLQRRLSEKGYRVITKKPDKTKLIRFKPFSSIAEARFVSVMKADWNDAFFDELEMFCGDGKTKDDQCDSCSDAVWALNRTIQLPEFVLPDLSQGNPMSDLNRF